MTLTKEFNLKGAIIIEGHIQGLSMTRSLGELDIPVYVVDKTNCVARYSKFARKFFLCPDFREDNFADFLIDLAVKENLSGWILLPSNDHAVITISKNKKKLAFYYKMLVPEYDKIELIYNKINLLNLASELEIAIPDTTCLTDTNLEDLHISFPVITKGKHGLNFYKALKTKGFISKDKKELKNHLEKIQSVFALNDTFTQTIINITESNKTISFTAFCVNGTIKTFWMGRKLREHPIRFGTATLAESIYDPVLIEVSQRLLRGLLYTGVCEIEYIKDPVDGEYKLIELNARTWLWVGLAISCGVNYPVYIYNYLNGIPNNFPSAYTIGLKWKNGITDFVYSILAVFTGLLSIKTIIRQSAGEKVSALLYKGDNLPAYIYGMLLFSYLRKR